MKLSVLSLLWRNLNIHSTLIIEKGSAMSGINKEAGSLCREAHCNANNSLISFYPRLKAPHSGLCCSATMHCLSLKKNFSRFVRPVEGAYRTVHGSVSFKHRKMFHANLPPLNENIAACSKHFVMLTSFVSSIVLQGKYGTCLGFIEFSLLSWLET